MNCCVQTPGSGWKILFLKGNFCLFFNIMLVWSCSVLINSSQTFCSTTDTSFYFWAILNFGWWLTFLCLESSDEETALDSVLADWPHYSFGDFFLPFLYVLVAMLQCHNASAVGEDHLRFTFQTLIAVSRSSINFTLINICQLPIIKSLKAERLLLKLRPKSCLKINWKNKNRYPTWFYFTWWKG